MKNRWVAFAVLGATLLGLAVFLAVRRDPARDAGPREEPTRVAEGSGVLPSNAGPTLVVQGTVLDAFDTPLPGAAVTLTPASGGEALQASTGADGAFRLAVPGEGRCSLQVEEPVWGRLSMDSMDIAADTRLSLRYEGKSSVAGEVRADDPDTLQSMSLWLVGPYRDPGQEPPRVPLSIADGSFARSGLPPGEYAVEGDCRGRSVKRSLMILVNGERKTIELELTAVLPRPLRGRAFLESKRHPLANEKLFVHLVTWQTSFQATATTGPDGSFELAPESNFWTTARFFRSAPSSPFVEVESTGSPDPLELIFASEKGRKGLLMTRRKEPLPFTDFTLRSSDRPDLRYYKTSDERGRFSADDIACGEYEASAWMGAEEAITTNATIPDEGDATVALPLDDFVVIEALDAGDRPVSRGYLYHVHCTPADRHIWEIRPFSPTPQGAAGSLMAAGEESSATGEGSPSGAAVLGLPPTGECAVEVLSLEHGWGRSTFSLPLRARAVQVRMAAPVETEITVSDANGSTVENPVFKYPGFHENAPLFPRGLDRFFDSLPENTGFGLTPLEKPGRFKVKLVPGSTISIEAPGRGRVLCEADRILKERAIVLE